MRKRIQKREFEPNKKQKKILHLLLTQRLSIKEILDLNIIPKSTLHRNIEKLCIYGTLKRVGKKYGFGIYVRGSKYK